MNKDRLLELLAKKKSGVITLPESRELQAYLQNNEEEQWLSYLTDEVFEATFSFEKNFNKQETIAAFENIQKKISNRRRRVKPLHSYRSLKWMAVAASFILMAFISYFFISKSKNAISSPNIVATKKGSKSTLTLPDGTKVWINADTKLAYGKTFGENTREVTVAGEAYFDVVRNSSVPFIVHTKAFDIKVLGTAFNVRAYDNEHNTQATLLRGTIEVILTNRDGKTIHLRPNEKIIVTNEPVYNTPKKNTSVEARDIVLTRINKFPKDSSIMETLWVKNKIAFDQQRLEDIATELERWYGVNIRFENEAVRDKRFTGILEDKSISQVMEALKLVADFQYSISGNYIVIK